MRSLLCGAVILTLAAAGCGRGADPSSATVTERSPAADPHASMPDDDAHRGVMPSDPMHAMGGMNTSVTLPDEIRSAWRAIRVDVVDSTTGESTTVEIPIGGSASLGDTGLTLEAVTFVPDFVMDSGGITSRSPEPNNPAARVVIREQGVEDYSGWLFASMPAVHAFPHDTYQVLLLEGVPAG